MSTVTPPVLLLGGRASEWLLMTLVALYGGYALSLAVGGS